VVSSNEAPVAARMKAKAAVISLRFCPIFVRLELPAFQRSERAERPEARSLSEQQSQQNTEHATEHNFRFDFQPFLALS
jgi:hypothetical protein